MTAVSPANPIGYLTNAGDVLPYIPKPTRNLASALLAPVGKGRIVSIVTAELDGKLFVTTGFSAHTTNLPEVLRVQTIIDNKGHPNTLYENLSSFRNILAGVFARRGEAVETEPVGIVRFGKGSGRRARNIVVLLAGDGSYRCINQAIYEHMLSVKRPVLWLDGDESGHARTRAFLQVSEDGRLAGMALPITGVDFLPGGEGI